MQPSLSFFAMFVLCGFLNGALSAPPAAAETSDQGGTSTTIGDSGYVVAIPEFSMKALIGNTAPRKEQKKTQEEPSGPTAMGQKTTHTFGPQKGVPGSFSIVAPQAPAIEASPEPPTARVPEPPHLQRLTTEPKIPRIQEHVSEAAPTPPARLIVKPSQKKITAPVDEYAIPVQAQREPFRSSEPASKPTAPPIVREAPAPPDVPLEEAPPAPQVHRHAGKVHVKVPALLESQVQTTKNRAQPLAPKTLDEPTVTVSVAPGRSPLVEPDPPTEAAAKDDSDEASGSSTRNGSELAHVESDTPATESEKAPQDVSPPKVAAMPKAPGEAPAHATEPNSPREAVITSDVEPTVPKTAKTAPEQETEPIPMASAPDLSATTQVASVPPAPEPEKPTIPIPEKPVHKSIPTPLASAALSSPEARNYLRETAPILEELFFIIAKAPTLGIADYDPADPNANVFPRDLQARMDSMKRRLQVLDSKIFAVIPPTKYQAFHETIRKSISETYQACDALLDYFNDATDANLTRAGEHLQNAGRLIQLMFL